MRTCFVEPAAGKQDCTASLIPQIEAAARRAGLAEGEYTVCVTEYAGHARELAHAAAQETAQSGEPLRIYTAGGDGTFMEAMTGVQGFPLRGGGLSALRQRQRFPAHLRHERGVCRP